MNREIVRSALKILAKGLARHGRFGTAGVRRSIKFGAIGT
jgi:hypothetical protein